MITHTKHTGYGISNGNIRYVTMWSDFMDKSGEMFFLPGEYSNIADFTLEKNGDICVGTYPFTNENHVNLLAEKHMTEISAILWHTFQTEGRDTVTLAMVADTGPTIVRREMFQRFYPFYQVKAELFLFDLPESEGGFPHLYFMSKEHQTGANQNILQIMADSSHSTFMPISAKPNIFAKDFMYLLYQAKMMGRFHPDMPFLTDVKFPNNGLTEPKRAYDWRAFDKLVADTGVDKLIAGNTGTSLVDTEPAEIVPAKKNEHLLDEWEENIVHDALQKEVINLSDMFNAGVQNTLEILGKSELYVDIFPDLPGIARRMCIYEGKIYVIPLDENFDAEDFFGESQEHFIMCTDETYPARTLLRKK